MSTREAATSRAFVVLGAACALVPSLAMWGFTVDDALIPVRYAHQLATGHGYRFNADGPTTDGVTPLPWAFVLAPFATGDAMRTLLWAKALGVGAWTVSGGVLGARVASIVRADRVRMVLGAVALAIVGLAFPIGAWAASGMETGVATALATMAVCRLKRPRQAAAIAGMAAALRPELVVWAMVVAAGGVLVGRGESGSESGSGSEGGSEGGSGSEGESGGESGSDGRGGGDARWGGAARAVGIALVPFAMCVVVRLVVFGRPVPLAVLAKPSDFSHGAIYAAAATLVVLTPFLVVAPVALIRTRGVAGVLVVAFLVHALVVAAVGGDWMPYARLMVVVAPSIVIAFAELTRSARHAWILARLAAAAILGVLVAFRAAPAGRSVHADRADLVARARPVLADANVVATLDVGWVGAATNARIVDLAGLTDPAFALLPGGHTSKRVDTAMLLDRNVDAIVLYSAPRVVESRIARSDLFAARYEAASTLPVGTRGAFYTVYRRRP